MLWGDRETGRCGWRLLDYATKGWLFLLAVVAWFTIASAASKRELLVSAAISLKEPLQEIGALFEQRHPEVKVVFNWGASGALQQQIEHGAPVDLYISAASKQMDELEAKGLLLNETRHTLAANLLVLIRSSGLRFDLASFKDLTKSEIKLIAVGSPRTVPAGEYAQMVLTSLGLWDSLQPKLIFTENVRQALAYVVRGEVEAALVYATDAQRAGESVRVIAVAPEGSAPLARYPIAVIKTSQQPTVARAFVDLALSEGGQQILKAHGFLPPPNSRTHSWRRETDIVQK
ncbi:MAG: molybdate ABC transporter substrate-binding protein [Candidatus Methylomirabilis oxygeniifera]|uniref:Molybdenum ABC transporter, periplasmic molybdate-binding protein n=1 Tax=Methylomirabilis oxygeniifera TaxID=671143 RepID=D5MEM2_METO1|nr:MAG: molybdate ABC transporter substrate-binding protein [Candidatus Methylomirabilis oxyfera]CBE68201.1 Molybdenum ABC transporter, periplasmic molybdate-binding protein [Candidatus Methylomirabilis oxyfera]